jgi:hypothetical protein
MLLVLLGGISSTIYQLVGKTFNGSNRAQYDDNEGKALIIACIFKDMSSQNRGSAVHISEYMNEGAVYDCIFDTMHGVDYGGAIWFDSPRSDLLRSCGTACTTATLGAFVQMGSGPFPNSNRHIRECSMYKCCSSDEGKSGACVSTNTDLINVNMVNFTEFPSSGTSAILITSSRGNIGCQRIGSCLRVVLNTANEAISCVRGINWSRIISSILFNNTVIRAVIYTDHVYITLTNCTFTANTVSSEGPEIVGVWNEWFWPPYATNGPDFFC